MSRRILLLAWELELLEPGGAHAPETKIKNLSRRPLSCAIDPVTGEPSPWIAPKSIIGSFAAQARQTLGRTAASWLLGDDLVGPHAVKDPAPSRLRFLGSTVTPPGDEQCLKRFRVAQDRHRGAAKVAHLVEQEWMPAGTSILIWAMADSTRTGQDDWPRLTADVRRVTLGKTGDEPSTLWCPVIGAGKSTGHGQTSLTSFRTRELDLAKQDDLAAYLRGLSPGTLAELLSAPGVEQVGGPPTPQAHPRLHQSRWAIDGGLHVGAGRPRTENGSQVDEILLDSDGHAVIPGTSWKGLLRSRVEFILRSLGIHVCDDGGTKSCDDCPACLIFGGTGQRKGSAGSGQAAAVRVVATPVLSGGEGARRRHAPHTHAAIDRFTGGAADSLLYSHDLVEEGEIVLEITQAPSRGPVPSYAIPLIEIALDDLSEGLIGLGKHSSRGYGTLRRTDRKPSRWIGSQEWTDQVARLRAEFPARALRAEEEAGDD